MTARNRERRRVGWIVVLLSAVAWLVLLDLSGSTGSRGRAAADICGATSVSWTTLRATLSPAALVSGVGLMLAAMMGPTLIAPILHVRERSFTHRRPQAITAFVLGYAAVWLPAGAALCAFAMALRGLAWPPSIPAALTGLAALVWQFSPLKQLCLNRAHNHRELRAHGLAADLDVAAFGFTHALWCVGSCWALMLLPMTLPAGHTLAMLGVTLLMVSERLERPRPLAWHLRISGKLLRISIAQTRLRLQARGWDRAPAILKPGL